MKFLILVLLTFCSVYACKAQNKLIIESILSKPKSVTRVVPETGKGYRSSTFVEVTERLQPKIIMQPLKNKLLLFEVQGNINSSGHSINHVKKIRFEKVITSKDTLTLQYFVEIKHIPGKEGNEIRGYNYKKQLDYKIPKGIKVIKLELYEDRISQRTGSQHPKLKLVANHIVFFSDNQ